jgi:hypothetical protein
MGLRKRDRGDGGREEWWRSGYGSFDYFYPIKDL